MRLARLWARTTSHEELSITATTALLLFGELSESQELSRPDSFSHLPLTQWSITRPSHCKHLEALVMELSVIPRKTEQVHAVFQGIL